MVWIAAGIVCVCLLVLVADFSRRWGPPRLWIDGRSAATWAVAAAVIVALALVAAIDY